MTERAKETAVRIFQILAEAESKAHGVPAEQVYFHEARAAGFYCRYLCSGNMSDNLDITEDCTVSV